MLKRLIGWYKKQSSSTQGFIIIITLLIVGIIIRWEYIINGIIKGFHFFSK
jgi:hypothetical protein